MKQNPDITDSPKSGKSVIQKKPECMTKPQKGSINIDQWDWMTFMKIPEGSE